MERRERRNCAAFQQVIFLVFEQGGPQTSYLIPENAAQLVSASLEVHSQEEPDEISLKRLVEASIAARENGVTLTNRQRAWEIGKEIGQRRKTNPDLRMTIIGAS